MFSQNLSKPTVNVLRKTFIEIMEDDPENLPLWLIRLVDMTQLHTCRLGYCQKEVRVRKKKNEVSKKGDKGEATKEQVCRFNFPQEIVGFKNDIKFTEDGQEFLNAVERETVKVDGIETVTIPEGGEVDAKHKKFNLLRNHPSVNSFVPEIGKCFLFSIHEFEV